MPLNARSNLGLFSGHLNVFSWSVDSSFRGLLTVFDSSFKGHLTVFNPAVNSHLALRSGPGQCQCQLNAIKCQVKSGFF